MSYHSSSTDKNPNNTMLLGYGTDRLMSWCPSLNIYRVNRFNILTNDKPRKKYESPWITDSGGQTSVSNYSVTMTNYKFNVKVISNNYVILQNIPTQKGVYQNLALVTNLSKKNHEID